MEFRCRLGTDSGEILERVCAADSEAALRRDLESKGFFLLSFRRQGSFAWPRLRA